MVASAFGTAGIMIRDTLMMVLMVAVHALAIVASRRVLDRYWGLSDSPSSATIGRHWEIVAGQIVLIWSAIVGGAFLLNAVGWLSPLAVYGVVGLISAVGILLIHEPMALATGRVQTEVAPVASAIGSGKFLRGIFLVDWFVVGLLFLGAIGMAQVLLFGIWQFPTDWDTLAYHLPIVDHWVQTGSLANQRCAFWYVPGNGELLGYWFSGPLSGDYFAQLSNIPVAVLLVVSLLGICERWGIDRAWQFLLVVLMVASQVMLLQLTSLENDLAAGSLFAASLLFGVAVVNRGIGSGNAPVASAIGLLLFGASVGLLAGIKYYSLGYAAVAIIACVLTICVYRGWIAALRVAGVALSGCVLLGGYWYFRNYWLGGSPLFPLGLPVLGIPDQWGSMRPESVTSTLLRGSTPEVWWLLLTAWLVQAGPIALVAMLLSPVFGIVGIWVWYRRKPEPLALVTGGVQTEVAPVASAIGSGIFLFLSLAMLGCVVVYLVTPNVIETEPGSRNMLRMRYHSVRFGYCLAILSLLFFVKLSNELYRWLQRKNQRWMACALLGCISLFVIGNLTLHLLPQYGWRKTLRDLTGLGVFLRNSQLDYPALDWALVTIDLFLAVIFVRALVKSTRLRFAIFGLVIILWTPSMSTTWHKGYDENYQNLNYTRLPIRLRELSGARRFCIGKYCYGTLLGSDRSGNAFRPLFLPTAEALKDYLNNNKIDFVAAPEKDSHWSKTYALMLEYMNSWKDEFAQVEIVDGYVIFERKNQTGVEK